MAIGEHHERGLGDVGRAQHVVGHRLGLSETLLVFPEHRSFLAPTEIVSSMKALRSAQPEKKLAVEVGSVDEAMSFAQAGAEVLQLERFSPAALTAWWTKRTKRGMARSTCRSSR